MGKATRWLRALLGMKREKNGDQISRLPAGGERKEKNRWSFSKSGKEFAGKVQKLPAPPPRTAVADADWQRTYPAEEEGNEHAIAIAAASAAAANAAVAAAQAAVAVVRLTSQTRTGLFNEGVEILAALRIQKCFRGFLARKALRALRGIVKLQALVRGFLVRKRAAATLHSMQALIRAQTTVRSNRARRSNNNKENKSQPETSPAGDITDLRSLFSDKILEIDSPFQNPNSKSRRFNSLLSDLAAADHRPSPYFWTMASPARFHGGEEECGRLSTAHSTPRGWVAAAGMATPARNVYGGGEGYFGPYPNYMASTKSFKAKLRSRSAPKQRPEVWTRKRSALNEIIGARNSISAIRMQKCCNRIHEDDGFDER